MAENQVFDPTSIILPESIDPTEEVFDTSSIIIPQKTEAQKILDQKPSFDRDLFKPTPILNPDGSTLNLGAVKLSDDGSSMVINDKSTINALLTSDTAPITRNQEDFNFWMNQKKKKSELLSQGYSLVDIDTQDYYDPDGSKEVKKRNAFDAIAEGARNLDFVPFIGNYIDIAELNNMYHLSVKFDKGTITDEEHEELYNFVEKNNEEYDNTFMAGVFDVLMKTPAFMGEMGGGWLLKEGVKGITKAGLKRVLSQNFKKKVKNSFNKRLTSNIVTKGPLKGLVVDKKQIAKGVADASLVTVLGAETGGMVQVGALEKYLNPRYQFDTDDMLMLSKEAISYDKAKTRARFDTYVEYMSEQTGGAIKWLGSPIKKNIQERLMTVGLYKALKKSNPSASAKDIRKIFETLGYHGIMEEMMEERVGEFARGIGYQLSKAGVLNDLDDPSFEYKVPSGKQLLTELVAFSVPGGVMKASTKIKDEYELSKVRGTKAYKSLQEARESGEYSEEALDMTEQFIRKNPNIDETTVLKFTGEALTVTKKSLSKGGIHHYLVEESGAKDANDLIAREGLDPNKYDDTTPLAVKGQTKFETMVDGTTKVLISLSNKADANTVIEEFYGNSYKTLSEQDKAVFDEYYNSQDTKMSRQEFFEKEGVKYFNNEGLYKETAIGKVFRKFKQYLQDIFGKANLPKDIRNFYDKAGLGGKVGKVTEKKTSFQLSPQKYAKIKDLQKDLIKEGEPSRFWYEKSGQALLDLVGGDKKKAKQLLSIISITSPNMKVKENFGQMIKGAYKYVQGQEPEAGRFPKGMAKKIKDVMQGKPYGGIKINSFLDNLMAQIEKPKDKPVTVDLWMMRAFGFTKDKPTDLEYKQIRKAIQDLADEIGWEPHQVQASIWTATMARWDQVYTKALDKARRSGKWKQKIGFISKEAEINFRNRLFKEFKKVSINPKDIAKANFDYSDALNNFKGIVSTETISDVEFGDVSNIPYNELQEYDQEIRQLLVDKNGKDKIAKLIGLLQAGKFNAPGFYEGSTAPAEHLEVLMSSTSTSINPETKSLLELYGSIYGLLTKQKSVGVTKVFKATSKKRANVVHITTKADIQFDAISQELLSKGYNTGAIPRQSGFNIVNFDNTVDNNKFFADVKEIINNIYENSSEDIIIKRSQSDGLLINNDWSKDKNGENYRQRISESNRSRDIGKFIDRTSNQINKVNEKYKKRWSERQVDPKRSFQLTPEQKEYFKDTKVVDEKGNPKVVYHGTIGTFDKFHPISYFTSDPEYASDVAMEFSQEGGENVKPVYLNIKNPKRYTTQDEYENFVMGPITDDLVMDKNLDKLIKQGYDGIIYEPEGGYGIDEIIAFKPEQIKSVYNKDPKSTGRSFSLEPTYFSTATRAVDKLSQSTQKQIKPQAVKSFLKKNQVKDEEIEFLNLEEYLSNYKPNERIPVEELAKFIKSNEVKITEIERFEDDFVDDDGVDYPLPQDKVAIHGDWQLGGEKEDYREITLSIPELEGPAFVRKEHWEEPNVIASVRMNTRYINNKKVLFIEELQSDLHTYGQKVGYNVPMHRRKDKTMSPEDKLEEVFSHQFEMHPQRLEKVGFRPPDAPYKGFDWVSLALKRILRHGAENNFDEIAFINAEQVIDRWDLSKRVEYLAYDKREVKGQPRLTVRGLDINDKAFDLGVLKTPEELERYLGKGVVDKMLRGEGTKPPHLNRKDRKKKETLLKGDDLKIKSRYMIDLYTNQIPQRLKKLTKKLGGRVGSASTVQIDPKQKQTYISITPKMKEKFIRSQRSFQLEPTASVEESIYKKEGKKYKKPYVPGGASYFFTPLSTELEMIHPALKDFLHRFEFKKNISAQKDRERILPFIEKFNSLNKTEKSKLDLALKNADSKILNEMLEQHNLHSEYDAVRNLLNEIYRKGTEVGYEFNYLEQYYPRKIKDVDGLLAYLQQNDPKSYGIIDKAIKEKLKQLDRKQLDSEEKSTIIASLIRGGNVISGKPGNLKNRKIETIDQDLNQFYEHSIDALLMYSDTMNEAIVKKQAMGKGELEDNIGAYVEELMAQGYVKANQQDFVVQALKDYFNYKGSGKFVQDVKNISYSMTMGSPISAITQIGDLAWAIYENPKETAPALLRSLVRKSKLKKEDLGIDRIGQEFQTIGGTAKAVNRIFKVVGLETMDNIGKEVLINSSLKKLQKQAQKPSEAFKAELYRIFGKESNQVIKDLKNGNTSENVKMLLFSKLLDFQPVALSEMPRGYINHPTGRIFYQLKTFTIKQMDIFRRKAIWKIRNPKTRVRGLKDLVSLAVIFSLANATADVIKDFILGRPTHIDDLVIDQMLRLVGISKYTTWKIRSGEIVEAVTSVAGIPIAGIIESTVRDAYDQWNNWHKELLDEDVRRKQPRVPTYVPVVGKLYYWWFGGGDEKIVKQEMRYYRDRIKDKKSLSDKQRLEYNKYLLDAYKRGMITENTLINRMDELKKHPR